MRHFTKKIISCLLVCALLGCSPGSSTVEKGTPIKIGAIFPLSGIHASTGEDIQRALLLGRDIINDSYQFDYPLARTSGIPSLRNNRIEIIIKDSASDPEHAAAMVEELVKKDRVCAIIGCYSSTVTARASEQAEMLNVPFLNPVSTSPVLTRRGLNWFFRTTPDDEIFAQNFFAFLEDLYAKKDISQVRDVVLVYENRLWGTGVARAETRAAKRYRYTIRADVPYDSKDTAFDREARIIEKAMPALIFQASYLQDAVKLVRHYNDFSIRPVGILGMNAGFVDPQFKDMLGELSENIFSREVWALDIGDQKPLVREVNRLFEERFGVPMTGNSARTFTGLTVLACAIDKAETLAKRDIRVSLRSIDLAGEVLIMPWEGVRFDARSGQNTRGRGIIVQVQDGEYKTVWPWDLASAEVRWPFASSQQ